MTALLMSPLELSAKFEGYNLAPAVTLCSLGQYAFHLHAGSHADMEARVSGYRTHADRTSSWKKPESSHTL